MEERPESHPVIVWILIFLHSVLGLNALGAGGSFIIAPDGHLIHMPLSNLERTPFSDFLLPGMLLFSILGICPCLVAYGLWRRPSWGWLQTLSPFLHTHWSWPGSLLAGWALIIWIVVQVQWLHVAFLHILCFVWGALIVALTLVPSVRRYYSLQS